MKTMNNRPPNRTIVELKFACLALSACPSSSPNRTIVELKYVIWWMDLRSI